MYLVSCLLGPLYCYLNLKQLSQNSCDPFILAFSPRLVFYNTVEPLFRQVISDTETELLKIDFLLAELPPRQFNS